MGCLETGSNPRFQFVNASITIGPLIASPSLSPGFERLIQSQLLDGDLATLLGDIENCTRAFKFQMPLAADLESTSIRIIQYQIPSQIDESSFQDQRSVIQQSIRLGAILYIETLRQKPLVGGIDYTLVRSRLKIHLLRIETTCTVTIDVLIWLLFVGANFSERADRSWFLAKLLDVLGQEGINTWDDAKVLLVRFLWVESIHEEFWQQLWKEVEAMWATRLEDMNTPALRLGYRPIS